MRCISTVHKTLIMCAPVFRIRIRKDPHKDIPVPPVSGSAWTDVDPDPGGKKA